MLNKSKRVYRMRAEMPYADMELNTIGFYVHYGRICMKKQWKIKNKYQE